MIVDGSGYAALDLSEAIEESDGRVAGPVATLSETLTILELAEASDVVMLLSEREVPIVLQISASLPHSLWDVGDSASVLVRPVDPRTVLETLLVEIGRSEMRASNRLASPPKEV